ncbi:hypothetical protein WL99_12485 [Burkholderia cepacia]|nr:hypothetical protein WL99_12485 [Burkholderia cepacia]
MTYQSSLFEQRYSDGRFEVVAGFHVLDHVQHRGEVRRIFAGHGRVYFAMLCVTHSSIIRRGQDWKHFGLSRHPGTSASRP